MDALPTASDLQEHMSFFDDWSDRYRYLIDLGKKLPAYPEDARDEAHKVKGCMSQVWLTHDVADGKLVFFGDSDATIVKGLIAVLFAAYSDKSAEEIAAFDLEAYFESLELKAHLSPNRRNGFFSMVERIKETASALS